MHAQALRKFGQIQNTIFILDGDQRGGEIARKIQEAAETGSDVPVLFLPSNADPESWVWERLRHISDADAAQLGSNRRDLSDLMNRLDAIYASAADRPAEIAKTKFRSLSEQHLGREAPEVCRVVARLEAERKESDIQPLVERLLEILLEWRE